MHPEIIGALIGIGGTVAIGIGTLSVRAYITSMNGNESHKKSNPEFRHCVDHYKLVEDISEIKTDVKWVVKRLNGNQESNN